MFKISYHDSFNDSSKYKIKSERFRVRYELVPDFKGFENITIHEAVFSSRVECVQFCRQLAIYFEDVFYQLEIYHLRLSMLQSQILNFDSVDLDITQKIKIANGNNSDIKKIMSSKKEYKAYQIIGQLLNYLDNLKILTVSISQKYRYDANKIFSLLSDLEISFINSYRSGKILFEENNLKLFQL